MKRNIVMENVGKFREQKTFGTMNGQLYEKKEGYYGHVRPEEAAKKIRSYLPDALAVSISTAALSEMYRQILTDQKFEFPTEKLVHPFLINTHNGVVDVRTGEMVDADDAVFLYQHNFSFEKDARLTSGTTFYQFLKTSLDLEKKKELLLQVMGYILSDIIGLKKAFFFLGPPDSGKSVMLSLLEKVIGEENTTAIPFNNLGSRFNRARLACSRVNICTELDSGRMRNVDAFKTITSNERIMGEHKGMEPFEFTVKTKLLSAGNVMPTLPELVGSDAILRRMVILRFADVKQEKDLDLCAKLWEERNIIFSLAVKEIAVLYKNGYAFTEPEDSVSWMREMQKCYQAVEEFVKERCEIRKDAQTHFVELWEGFWKFCEENGCEIRISKLQFSQKIASIPGISHSRFRKYGKSLRGYKGIGLKEQ